MICGETVFPSALVPPFPNHINCEQSGSKSQVANAIRVYQCLMNGQIGSNYLYNLIKNEDDPCLGEFFQSVCVQMLVKKSINSAFECLMIYVYPALKMTKPSTREGGQVRACRPLMSPGQCMHNGTTCGPIRNRSGIFIINSVSFTTCLVSGTHLRRRRGGKITGEERQETSGLTGSVEAPWHIRGPAQAGYPKGNRAEGNFEILVWTTSEKSFRINGRFWSDLPGGINIMIDIELCYCEDQATLGEADGWGLCDGGMVRRADWTPTTGCIVVGGCSWLNQSEYLNDRWAPEWGHGGFSGGFVYLISTGPAVGARRILIAGYAVLHTNQPP